MSHSTTKTSSYIMSKYSRAYPVKRNFSKTRISSDAGSETMQEWQHFTNPTMRLFLDMKIASNKELESVRLRIVWSINATVDAEVTQQDVIFEDLDLLSFSSITAPVARKHQTEGLPLKAVYRDTVVGIRYFHGREDGITPVYRRFQISFLSASDASDFVTLIKPVCPCRLNPTSAPSFATPQTQPVKGFNALPPNAQERFTSSTSLLPDRGSSFAYPFPVAESIPFVPAPTFAQPQPPAERPFLTKSFTLSSSPLRQDLYTDGRSNPATTSNMSPSHQVSQIPSSACISHQNDVPNESLNSSNVPGHSSSVSDISAFLNHRITLPGSSLPSIPSSEPSAPITDSTQNNNPSVPVDRQDGILASIVEAASIYDLSHIALEQVIAQIINEDGFPQLVEKISNMTIIRRVADV